MEIIRSASIIIEIDTNKATYKEEFQNMTDAIEFWNSHCQVGDEIDYEETKG